MVSGWVWRAALVLGPLLAGCAETPTVQVRSAFSKQYKCESQYVRVVPQGPGYEATGCEHGGYYECADDACRFKNEVGEQELSDRRAKADAEKQQLLDLQLDDFVQLHIVATPGKSERVQFSVAGQRDCALELMVDGQRLDLAKATAPTSVYVPRAVMRDIRVARQVKLRACQTRWGLDDRELEALRQFVSAYEEELAWRDTPREGGTGGRRAPIGGWPAWQPLPGAVVAAGEPLGATELFQKLAPSVLRVEAKLEDGFAQGSAVAVTPSLVITNCHVVAGAGKIVVKQAKEEHIAQLKRSDPAKDRCVLEVAGAAFTPVAGVRAYGDLKVGEALYTLGNPSGLDLTLANGILSALREEKGVRYVQTTAPISPGSSGGGLFDARGNLVGVTTLAVVGKEHLNQSLNFAIAAHSYWAP